MKRIINNFAESRLMKLLFGPDRNISGRDFFYLVLLRSSFVFIVNCINSSEIVIFPLSVCMFYPLFKYRLSDLGFRFRPVSFLMSLIVSFYLYVSLNAVRVLPYILPPYILYPPTWDSPLYSMVKKLAVINLFVVAAAGIMTIVFVVLFSFIKHDSDDSLISRQFESFGEIISSLFRINGRINGTQYLVLFFTATILNLVFLILYTGFVFLFSGELPLNLIRYSVGSNSFFAYFLLILPCAVMLLNLYAFFCITASRLRDISMSRWWSFPVFIVTVLSVFSNNYVLNYIFVRLFSFLGSEYIRLYSIYLTYPLMSFFYIFKLMMAAATFWLVFHKGSETPISDKL